MDKEGAIGITAAILFTLGMIALAIAVGPAFGAECPPDKPNKRIIEGQVVSCTLVSCLGKLICDGQKCWHGIAADCNICTRAPDREICLSDDELAKAK